MDPDQNLTCLIIEGDSKIIIDLAIKILNGIDPRKITPDSLALFTASRLYSDLLYL
jgi:hypothetical protein